MRVCDRRTHRPLRVGSVLLFLERLELGQSEQARAVRGHWRSRRRARSITSGQALADVRGKVPFEDEIQRVNARLNIVAGDLAADDGLFMVLVVRGVVALGLQRAEVRLEVPRQELVTPQGSKQVLETEDGRRLSELPL